MKVRLCDPVFPVRHFLCTNLVRFLNSSIPSCCMDSDDPNKSFCFVRGQLITGNDWGRRESVSIEQIKK